MPRKPKRRVRSRPRPAGSAPSRPASADPVTPAPPARAPIAAASRAGARPGGDQLLVRSVEMSLGGATRQTRRGGRMVIEGGNPAIPLANVPYFTRDLVRLAWIGGAMIVLLVVSALLVVPRIR